LHNPNVNTDFASAILTLLLWNFYFKVGWYAVTTSADCFLLDVSV